MPRCKRCSKSYTSGQVCHLRGVGYYDVDLAYAVVRALRLRPTTVPLRTLRRLFRSNVHPAHVDHVSRRVPGVLGLVRLPDGSLLRFVLEGNHRVAKSIKIYRPCRMYVLTEEQTRRVLTGRRPPRGKRFSR